MENEREFFILDNFIKHRVLASSEMDKINKINQKNKYWKYICILSSMRMLVNEKVMCEGCLICRICVTWAVEAWLCRLFNMNWLAGGRTRRTRRSYPSISSHQFTVQSINLSINLIFYPSISIYFSIHPSTSLSIHLLLYPSIYFSIYQSSSLNIDLLLYTYIYFSVNPSASFSINLFL